MTKYTPPPPPTLLPTKCQIVIGLCPKPLRPFRCCCAKPAGIYWLLGLLLWDVGVVLTGDDEVAWDGEL
jgi:hypothetical protein